MKNASAIYECAAINDLESPMYSAMTVLANRLGGIKPLIREALMIIGSYPVRYIDAAEVQRLIAFSADELIGEHRAFSRHPIDVLDPILLISTLEYFVSALSVGGSVIKWRRIDAININYSTATIIASGVAL